MRQAAEARQGGGIRSSAAGYGGASRSGGASACERLELIVSYHGISMPPAARSVSRLLLARRLLARLPTSSLPVSLPSLPQEDAFNLVKFYTLERSLVYSILSATFTEKLEFPFLPDETEHLIISLSER